MTAGRHLHAVNPNPQPRPGWSPEPWLSKRQLAKHLSVSVRYVEYQIAAGMPHRRLGGMVRLRRSECEAWLEGRGEGMAA